MSEMLDLLKRNLKGDDLIKAVASLPRRFRQEIANETQAMDELDENGTPLNGLQKSLAQDTARRLRSAAASAGITRFGEKFPEIARVKTIYGPTTAR